jgi:hypothetical protein
LKQKRHHTASGFHYSLVDLTDWVELTRRHYARATGRHVDAPEEIEAWAEHPEVGETEIGDGPSGSAYPHSNSTTETGEGGYPQVTANRNMGGLDDVLDLP